MLYHNLRDDGQCDGRDANHADKRAPGPSSASLARGHLSDLRLGGGREGLRGWRLGDGVGWRAGGHGWRREMQRLTTAAAKLSA